MPHTEYKNTTVVGVFPTLSKHTKYKTTPMLVCFCVQCLFLVPLLITLLLYIYIIIYIKIKTCQIYIYPTYVYPDTCIGLQTCAMHYVV